MTKKFEAKSLKGSTKDLINVYKVINGAGFSYLGARQNNLIYFSYKFFLDFSLTPSKFYHGDQ